MTVYFGEPIKIGDYYIIPVAIPVCRDIGGCVFKVVFIKARVEFF